MNDFLRHILVFQHQSYNQALKEVHLPSNFQQTHLDHEVGVSNNIITLAQNLRSEIIGQ